MEDDVLSIAPSSSWKTPSRMEALIPVGSMPYRNFRISIFKKPGRNLFYYEPIVVLDPKSIDRSSGKVGFKIELWNIQLEQEIAKFLQEFEEFPKNSRLQVMPYEQVQLVKLSRGKRGTIGYSIYGGPKPYLQLHQSIEFKVFSFLKISQEAEFEYLLGKILALEFTMAGQSKRFNFNILRKIEDEVEQKLDEPFQGKKHPVSSFALTLNQVFLFLYQEPMMNLKRLKKQLANCTLISRKIVGKIRY